MRGHGLRSCLVEDTDRCQSQRRIIQSLRNEPVGIAHVVNCAGQRLNHPKHHVPRAILLDAASFRIFRVWMCSAFVREQLFPCPVVRLTGLHGSLNVAVLAMNELGAVRLPSSIPSAAGRILVTLGNAVERQKLEDLVETYRQEIDRDGFLQTIGTAPSMQAVYRIIENAADSKASIFIKGESGTGKEVTAEAIHRQSKRRNKPFVALNCAAIPMALPESAICGQS